MKAKKPKKTVIKDQKEISRKEAIKKLGYISLSAATMMLLLNEPAKGQSNPDSPGPPDEW